MGKKILSLIGIIILGFILIFAVPSAPRAVAPTNNIATSTISATPKPVRGDQPDKNILTGTSNIVKAAIQPVKTEEVEKQSQKIAEIPATRTKSLTLVVGETRHTFAAPENMTLYDSMSLLASTTSFTFTSKEFSGLGYRIESINGKVNADGTYWTLYINGEYANVGASTYVPKDNDVIEWKYLKL